VFSTRPCDERTVRIYLGDMFDVTAETLGGQVDAVWDRAAFVGGVEH
jgi:Thiopurine S-methyltransferase (TPMT)